MKRLLSILLLCCLTIGIRAGNVVTIGTAEGTPGDEVTVSVALQNDAAVSALQLQIPLPAQLQLVAESSTLTSRGSNHAVKAGVKNDTLNIMVYSTSMATIAAGSGDLLTFKLKLGREPGTYALTPAKLILTDSSGTTLTDATTTAGSVTIRAAKASYSTMTINYGRVPIRSTYTQPLTINNVGNAPLEVTALNFSSDRFTCAEPLPFTIEGGGSKQITISYAPVERGTVKENLSVVCNSTSKLNNITLTAQPFAVNEIHLQDASGQSDSIVTIHITMNNMDAITGLQLQFELPSTLQYVDGSFVLSDRKQDQQLAVSLVGSTLRALSFSSNGNAFSGNDGEVASFKVKLLSRYDVTLEPSVAKLVAVLNKEAVDVLSAKYGATVHIVAPQIDGNSEIDMGSVPVTQDATSGYTIQNYGSAPLIINKVDFNENGFTIDEALPLTIDNWSSKEIHVRYTGIDETAHEAHMHIYCNDPELRMKDVTVKVSRYAPNSLSISSVTAYAGSTAEVDLNLSNYDEINGLQFDVTRPTGFTAKGKVDGSGSYSVIVKDLGNGKDRYFVYSLSNEGLKQWAGKVLSLQYDVASTVTPGDYTLQVDSIKLGTGAMKNKSSQISTSFTITVKKLPMMGDVNDDGVVDISDASAIASYLVGDVPSIFVKEVADYNKDGSIDISDASAIASVIVGDN